MRNLAVICGGLSSEFEISLRSAQTIIKHFPKEYKCHKIVLDADGWWYDNPENTIAVDSDSPVINAIRFLESYKKQESMDLGKHVVVAGAGNTAMDTARAATRMPGVETVSIVYRRTKEYMPADREELDFAQEDGVLFKELLNPVSLKGGKLTCEVMELGAPDASGRRSPVGTGRTAEVDCDTLISSIGEKVETSLLEKNGVAVGSDGYPVLDGNNMTSVDGVYLGGDGKKGPSTVVKAIADAMKREIWSDVDFASYGT